MRFWFVHSRELSLHEQIVRQVSLGILTGELAPGERLPSIRALARRYGMHPNTVSSAYRQLHERQWVTYRKGSGVYVCPHSPSSHRETRDDFHATRDGAYPLDHLLDQAVRSARKLGLGDKELICRLARSCAASATLTLVEADPELVHILLFEIQAAGRQPPLVCPLPPELFHAALTKEVSGSTPVVLPSKAAAARAALGESAALIVLAISPVAASLAQHLPRSREHLVAIVSHWPSFLEITRSMLLAAGFAPEALLSRDAREPGWTSGLELAAGIVCDSYTGSRLPPGMEALVFSLLTREALSHFAPLRSSSL